MVIVCKTCGDEIPDDEECPANTGFDDEMVECFSCHCRSLEYGEITQCECCGSYFSGTHLEVNPENGDRELCPYCHGIWCE